MHARSIDVRETMDSYLLKVVTAYSTASSREDPRPRPEWTTAVADSSASKCKRSILFTLVPGIHGHG
jgi:hypothetical protein